MYAFDMRKLMTYTKGIILYYLSIVFSFSLFSSLSLSIAQYKYYVHISFTRISFVCHLFSTFDVHL